MKATFIAMVSVLVVSLALCLVMMYLQFDAIDTLDDMRAEAFSLLMAEDLVGARKALGDIAEEFERRSNTLELFASHEDLHDAYCHILSAMVCIECEDIDDTYQSMAQFGEMLNHLREHEGLSIANLC